MPRNAEAQIQAEILNALGSRRDIRLFRNTVGHAFSGNLVESHHGKNGLTVTLQHARRTAFGLAVGSGDLIGLQSVIIGPEDVGTRIARFLSIEVKSKRGRLTAQQKAWLEMVRRFGGFGVVARALEDVEI